MNTRTAITHRLSQKLELGAGCLKPQKPKIEVKGRRVIGKGTVASFQ